MKKYIFAALLFIPVLILAETKSWQEVTQLPEYKSLSSEEKENARNEYFFDVVVPTASDLSEIKQLRADFDAETRPLATNNPYEAYFQQLERQGLSTRKVSFDRKAEQLKFYECVLDKMEDQRAPNVLGIVMKYCEILHPEGSL